MPAEPRGNRRPHPAFFRVRGGAITAKYPDNANNVDLISGRRTVTIYGETQAQSRRVARALRRRSRPVPPTTLPAPVLPPPALAELKRILVARRPHPTVRAIARATGVPRAAVRTRLTFGRLLGSRALAGVQAPRRSWRAVERDRQIAIATVDFGRRRVARDERITLTQLSRIIHRVRGLTGLC